jgi:uncharacterized membrane protein
MKARTIGILILIFGLITFIPSLMVYQYQMSQDGKIEWITSTSYIQSYANPEVVALMTAGMAIGVICIVIGLVIYAANLEKISRCPNCGELMAINDVYCHRCGWRR